MGLSSLSDARERRNRRQTEADMVAEVARRWAETLRDVASLGGVTPEHLAALVASAAALAPEPGGDAA